MVYKTKFLKKRVEDSYDKDADGLMTTELTDDALAAIWIGIKGDFVQANLCIDDLVSLVTSIDLWFGGFNVIHYANTIDAIMANMLLKQSRPMIIGNGQAIDDVMGIEFPLLLGAPYINPKMALPKSHSNRKVLTMTLDIANAYFDDLLIDIHEVILPDGKPIGFIKQEEVSQEAKGTGDKDIPLQTNWDLLKLILRAPTVPVDAAWTRTINRAGLEIDDFVFGYQACNWEVLHSELMDEITGMAGIENHTHLDSVAGACGLAEDLETWIRYYAVLDFFFNKDLAWRAPIAGASTAKIKVNYGVDEAIRYRQLNYVGVSKMETHILRVS